MHHHNGSISVIHIIIIITCLHVQRGTKKKTELKCTNNTFVCVCLINRVMASSDIF